MAIERFYEEISPVAFTADGQANGIVTIDDTYCFKVKMDVIIKADGKDPVRLQVKRVLNKTMMRIGPSNKGLNARTDLSEYTLAINSTIQAPEQERPNIPPADYERAVYEEEPTVAKRVFNVDKYGKGYTVKNPFPVRLSDGSVNIGTVNAELEVQLTHRDNYPDGGDVHDSIRIGGASGAEADVTLDNRLKVSAIVSPNDDPKGAIMCAQDVHVDYTWSEINGVRRIVQIKWSSTQIATNLGLSEASVTRDYIYQIADPYDLIDRDDTLTLTP
jgi:hypothetical protein